MFKEAALAALRQALGEDADAVGDLAAQLTPPPKIEMGDLAFPCFPLAKIRRAAPPKIAAELAAAIAEAGTAGGPIAEVKALGPYVNFFADPAAMLDGLHMSLADGSFFEGCKSDTSTRVMIEFSQPNTHKVFHVGHLRNVAVGDALVRVFRARGHDVVAANYYGDFGIDVAKCLWWLNSHAQEEPPTDGRTAWLGKAYTAATLHVAAAEAAGKEQGDAIKAEIRAVLTAMEEGEPEITALYQKTRQWCLDEFAGIYDWLDVRFDHEFFESQLEEAGNKVVDDYVAKGVFVESQGAIISDLEEDGCGVALVRKSDGSSLYMTWDLALARAKFDEFDVQTSMYVVGSEQTLHFKQLFATLGKMGYARAKDCRHVSYELVMLPEGKMSSRKGTAIPFHLLRTHVLDAIRAKMAAAGSEVDDEAASKIAIACLKYGMLHVGNTRSVIFDIDEWTNPEGDTGAYLLYSLARIAGIQRKAGDGVDVASPVPADSGFGGEAERALLTHLTAYPSVLARVERTCDPSGLAGYVFEGAKRFSRFYQECPVVKAEPALKHARLKLAASAQRIFTEALGLLGIDAVEVM